MENQSKNTKSSEMSSSCKVDSSSCVEVFCRLRPTDTSEEDQCLKILNATTLLVSTPLSKAISGTRQEVTCTFGKIFQPNTPQKDVFQCVALDMVEDLVKRKNGLLFTYGVTGSGKTYTVGGTSSDPGILPRCITTLYNSVKGRMAAPGTIRLDRYGQVELLKDAQSYVLNSGVSTVRKGNENVNPVYETPACLRKEVADTASKADPDALYSIFVSMLEIYNNNVFDLLDEHFDMVASNKIPSTKQLRENTARGMYIPGLSYVEVHSISEALTFYRKGKKRRRVGQTVLNAESSRSHCVFTLYLAQIHSNSDPESICRFKTVNQLSLCDLAGSERSYRTLNEGERQKESSLINSSLMILRNCIESLRDNQKHVNDPKYFGQPLIVPYRESKLTLLFRNYFEGDGKVRMILCLNGIAGDFEENLHVVRFSEITQEVKIKAAEPPPLYKPKEPNRRRNEPLSSISKQERPSSESTAEAGCTMPPYPLAVLSTYDDDQTLPNLISYLQEREGIRANMKREMKRLGDELIGEIVEIENSNTELKEKNEYYKQAAETFERKYGQLKHSYKSIKQRLLLLDEKNKELTTSNKALEDELDQLRQSYTCERSEKINLKRILKESKVSESDRLERECNKRVKEATEDMKSRIRNQDYKLRVMKDVIKTSSDLPPITSDSSERNTLKTPAKPVLHLGARTFSSAQTVRKRKSSTSNSEGDRSKRHVPNI